MWGQSEMEKGVITQQFPQTHEDVCRIMSEFGEDYRLDSLQFNLKEGFAPDGENFPLGEVKANYSTKKKMLWNKAQRESKGVRLVNPDSTLNQRVVQVQGFIDEDRTLGIWCMGTDGKVLSSFNPSGLIEPKGTVHKLRLREEIVGNAPHVET
eukprot:CAMPEP_0170450700 /NCGR_PEP_ID=MMETSP0123-20130129/152_1 /TAXON_ID=182087 /ORGANISM="Favella ehrenbergii, Strain Fehren 1" /LENGTH=152 /DNA_ID=CAMNT_0010712075 /DNA_START=63 /DNA_END=522 /DNA_ORIENTATION=+